MMLMDGPRHERRHHFRGKARPGRILPIKYRVAETEPWTDSETRNIGVGGAFITCTSAPEIGHEIDVELILPTNERKFTLPAVVRWVAVEGMGVQFVNVDVDVLLELNDYFSTLTGQQ